MGSEMCIRDSPTTAPDGGTEASSVGSSSNPTYNVTVQGANDYAQMVSNIGTGGGGVANTPTGSGGVVHGPAVVSENAVTINGGATVQFDWSALAGADAYDVMGYIVNVDTGESFIMLNATGATSTATHPTETVSYTVTETGNYKFVFVSGSWDATKGTATGATLTIDNISITNNYNPTTGKVTATDADSDALAFSAGSTAKGSVTFDSDGTYHYIPTAAALAAANAPGATIADQTDTFVVTADDGHGGTDTTTVSVYFADYAGV